MSLKEAIIRTAKEANLASFSQYSADDTSFMLVHDHAHGIWEVNIQSTELDLRINLTQVELNALLSSLATNKPYALMQRSIVINLIPGSKEDRLAIKQVIVLEPDKHQTYTYKIPYRVIASLHSDPFDYDCFRTIDHCCVGLTYSKGSSSVKLMIMKNKVSLFSDYCEVEPAQLAKVLKALQNVLPLV